MQSKTIPIECKSLCVNQLKLKNGHIWQCPSVFILSASLLLWVLVSLLFKLVSSVGTNNEVTKARSRKGDRTTQTQRRQAKREILRKNADQLHCLFVSSRLCCSTAASRMNPTGHPKPEIRRPKPGQELYRFFTVLGCFSDGQVCGKERGPRKGSKRLESERPQIAATALAARQEATARWDRRALPDWLGCRWQRRARDCEPYLEGVENFTISLPFLDRAFRFQFSKNDGGVLNAPRPRRASAGPSGCGGGNQGKNVDFSGTEAKGKQCG
jgi:hypothetical protein